MKVKFLLLILFSISFTFCNSQPLIIDWQNCFGGPGNEKAFDLVSTGDGYIILVSHYVDEIQGRNIQLLKTDTGGNIVWEKSLGGTKFDEPCRIFSAGNGNYFITSVATSSDGDITNDPYPTAMNNWILKINGSGEILWEKIYGGTCIDNGNFGTTTSDGSVIAYCYTCSDDGDITNNYGSYDAWMVKVDSLGNKVWDFTIGHNNGDFSNAIIETSDRGILAALQSYRATGGNIECEYFNEYTDIVLFKLDSVANIEWQQCYGGSQIEYVYDIIETTDGYILAGSGESDDGDLAGSGYHLGYDNNGNQTSDIWLLKIDFTGNVIWSKCYGGTRNEYANRVFQTGDGGFIIFGETGSFDGDVTGNHSAGPGISDIWVIRIDSIGQLLWQQCIGGNGYDRLVLGVVDNGDGSFVIASTIYDFNSGQVECPTTNGSDQVWLIKVMDTTVVNIHEKPLAGNGVKAYPNPANDYVIFEEVGTRNVASKKGNEPTLLITDIYGRAVAHLSVIGDKTIWDVRGVAPGVYLYQIINGSISDKGKLMISH
ncbi:MAG: T9SS type A sorting domain-containing protein [Bacteroidales bacterium]|jgi:hypothetical protein|nr:T9SS type A sorting domain-containing protein [Bacteroidales bacterium]